MLLDSDASRLHHMIDAIHEILQFAQGRSRESLSDDRPLQHLIVRNLEILGEAACRMSQECRLRYPQIPWRDMIDLRNRLIHSYFDLNLDIIWNTVHQDLPGLLPQLRALCSPSTGNDEPQA